MELSNLAQTAPSIWISIILTAIGMIAYWGFVLQNAKKKLKDRFQLELWWYDHSLEIGLSGVVATGIFIASYVGDTLTMERCLWMGLLTSLFINKLKKAI